jgi:CheY-like chemotaxis protein
MTFQALLASTDEASVATLTPVLSGFDMAVRSCDPTTAVTELTVQKFDAVVVDFDDPQRAGLVLQSVCLASPRSGPVSVALLSDRSRVRHAFGAGANFVLFKPINSEEAEFSLRAAVALIKRERRRSLRVPVQVSVQLRVANGLDIEGILLDLSEDGLEVLSSQPLAPSASLALDFSLPGGAIRIQSEAEVVWASPNGQAGVRFVHPGDGVRRNLREWVSSHAQRYNRDEAENGTPGELTDLSEGGCYVETTSPFPERSGVILHLKANEVEVQAQGMVRVMHPGFGMGVEFASYTAEQRQEVANFIRLLASQPGTAPQLLVAPHALGDTSEAPRAVLPYGHAPLDPLLDLLRSHETFSQEEFLQELHGQRRGAASSFAG